MKEECNRKTSGLRLLMDAVMVVVVVVIVDGVG